MNISVFLGSRVKYSDGLMIYGPDRTNSEKLIGLTIDGEQITSIKCMTSDLKWYLKTHAVKLAGHIKKKKVPKGTTYLIVNGKRIRHTNNEVVGCDPLNECWIRYFRSELDKALATEVEKTILATEYRGGASQSD